MSSSLILIALLSVVSPAAIFMLANSLSWCRFFLVSERYAALSFCCSSVPCSVVFSSFSTAHWVSCVARFYPVVIVPHTESAILFSSVKTYKKVIIKTHIRCGKVFFILCVLIFLLSINVRMFIEVTVWSVLTFVVVGKITICCLYATRNKRVGGALIYF